MAKSPHISVVIPVYNQAKYLGNAIQSVLAQTYRNVDLIVVDDGSTDKSRDVAQSFGDQVHYIWQENRGLGGARNTGIRAAEGELIGLLDADDEWRPEFLVEMVSLAVSYPEAAVYYCCGQGMDVDGRNLPQRFGGPVTAPEETYHKLLRANFLIPSTIVMRRALVVAAGLFEETLRTIHGCEDWDLWLRLAAKFEFAGTAACLVRYRLHGSSLSTNSSGMQQAVQAVMEKNFGPDDGKSLTWSWQKRRAYGGIYRYKLLTSVQRQNDWGPGNQYLSRALQYDPALATDLDLFHDLALGSQPIGYRGSLVQLDLEDNASQIVALLDDVFNAQMETWLPSLRRPAYGTAYYALGLVAYNRGQLSLARRFFLKALRYRPELWRDGLIMGNVMKSLVGSAGLNRLRLLRQRLSRLGSV